MGGAFAGPVVALKVEAGAIGFFVVVLLCVAAAGIFVMMSRSLKRMRGNVASGEFRGTEPKPGRAPAAVPVTVPGPRTTASGGASPSGGVASSGPALPTDSAEPRPESSLDG